MLHSFPVRYLPINLGWLINPWRMWNYNLMMLCLHHKNREEMPLWQISANNHSPNVTWMSRNSLQTHSPTASPWLISSCKKKLIIGAPKNRDTRGINTKYTKIHISFIHTHTHTNWPTFNLLTPAWLCRTLVNCDFSPSLRRQWVNTQVTDMSLSFSDTFFILK